MWKFFAGVVLGFVAAAGAGFWLLEEEYTKNVLFQRSQIYKLGDYAHISGSIVGEGKEEATGYSLWECSKAAMACDVVTVEAMSHNQVHLYPSERVRVSEWGERFITINSRTDDPEQCNFYEIKADFETNSASYTRFPKSAEGRCATLDQRIYNWRLADSFSLRYPDTD